MKRTIYTVIAIHVVLLGWMAISRPTKVEKKREPIVVQMIELTPASPAPPVTQVAAAKPAKRPIKKVPQKTTPKKKPIAKKAPARKTNAPTKVAKPRQTPAISPDLVKELEESIAKIEKTGDKVSTKKQISTPRRIASLQIDKSNVAKQVEESYLQMLVAKLQNSLDLPEVGLVKIELTLANTGAPKDVKVLHSESNANRVFLQQALTSIHFPAFRGSLKKEKEHAFVITFCNR